MVCLAIFLIPHAPASTADSQAGWTACSAGCEGPPWTCQHLHCTVSCPVLSFRGLRQRLRGGALPGPVGKRSEVTPGTPAPLQSSSGRFGLEKSSLAFQGSPLSCPLLGHIEKEVVKRRIWGTSASLPSTPWPAVEPQCVCQWVTKEKSCMPDKEVGRGQREKG